MTDTAEPWEWLPPLDPAPDDRPVPTCPACGGMLRRRNGALVCDLHGAVERLARSAKRKAGL
jgi:hypothetical protein